VLLQMRVDKHEGCTVHVGGVTGFLEDESLLQDFCQDHFGPVLAATVRIRHDQPGKTSWAMVTFSTRECAEQMITVLGPDVVLDPRHPGNEHDNLHTLREKAKLQDIYKSECVEILKDSPEHGAAIVGLGPIRLVDRLQVWGSSGSMGKVFGKHQRQVDKEVQFQARRVKSSRERYADAVLASRLKREYQDPGFLVVLKDEARKHDPLHRGWDVRVRPRDRMFDLMRKIRERLDGMADAEGIVRTDSDPALKLGRKARIRAVQQMKHARTYLIRRRAAPLPADVAFELGMRFERDDPHFQWKNANGSAQKHELVVNMQRIYRLKAGRKKKLESEVHMERTRAAVTVQSMWRMWISRIVYTAFHRQSHEKPSFRENVVPTRQVVEVQNKGARSKWGTVRSQHESNDSLQQQLAKKHAKNGEAARKQRLTRQRWDKLRRTDAFQSVVMAKTGDGDLLGAFRHVRAAQARLCYRLEWQKTAALAKEKADAATAESALAEQALNLAQRRRRGAIGRQMKIDAVATSSAAATKRKLRPSKSGSGTSSDVLLQSAIKVADRYDRIQEQRTRLENLAKPTPRVCPPPRPAPMSTANYIVSGGEDCSSYKPVVPVPTPASAKEAALLMSGGSPTSSLSPRQRRATLSAAQLLARRGYLTPRDLSRMDATRGSSTGLTPGSGSSPDRTARPSTAVPVPVASETPGMEKTPNSARPASASQR
jgi:hypothetical protein